VSGVTDHRRVLLLDTNILLVLLVGLFDPGLLQRFKRTSRYADDDFAFVQTKLEEFAGSTRMITTAHILTEVSNLTGQLREPARSEVRKALAALVREADEEVVPAKRIVEHDRDLVLGVADTAIELAVESDSIVFTDDFHLSGLLEARGVEVLNLRREKATRRTSQD